MKISTLCRGAAVAALTAAAGAGIAQAQVATSWPGSPRVAEEDRQFKINGRIQYDVYDVKADFPGTGQDQDYAQADIRRLFLGVEGRFTDHWRYNIKAQFKTQPTPAAGAAPSVTVDDAFLEYNGGDWSIFAGQYNPTSPMEDRNSSLNTPFNERSSFINAFAFGKKVGLWGVYSGGNWSLAAGVNGAEISAADFGLGNEEIDESARATWAPIYQKTPDGIKLVHLGLSLRHRDNGGANQGGNAAAGAANSTAFNYAARPDVGFGTSFVSSTAFGSQDDFLGAEVAGQWNQFGVDGEYGHLTVHPQTSSILATPNKGDRGYQGGYLNFYWSPTGESRNYNAAEGSFGRVTPLRTLGSDNGIGYIQLAARYEYLDLSDEPANNPARGGKQTGYVAQVTWQPIAYVKFQLDYAKDKITNYLGAPATNGGQQRGDADVVVARMQIDW